MEMQERLIHTIHRRIVCAESTDLLERKGIRDGVVKDSWPASGNVEGRISCQDGRMNVELFQIKVKPLRRRRRMGISNVRKWPWRSRSIV
jgi:hypothetical protein